jgi:formylglycine-generating enzyme required for sulfatase activity
MAEPRPQTPMPSSITVVEPPSPRDGATGAPLLPDTVVGTIQVPAERASMATVITGPADTEAVPPGAQPVFNPPRVVGEPPRDLGGYHLGKKIGSGGMGAVYAAVGADGVTTVAMKVLRPDLAAVGEEFMARFRREANAMAEVNHPNLVRLLGSGEDRGWLWLAMEYMPDGDLGSYLKRRGQLMEKDAVSFAVKCGKGLQALHARGLVHRDFKPENVFLDQGRGKAGAQPSAKVGDLGLARHTTGEDRMTMTGTACGTPAYMAPEQVRGDSDLDQRVDVYALGACLFKLVTGQDPFIGNTVFMLTNSVLKDPAPDPRKYNPLLTPGLSGIILKALAKDRKDRYRDMGEMIGDLERLSEGKIMTNTAVSPASMIFQEVAGQQPVRPEPRVSLDQGDGWLSGLGGMGPVLRLAVPALLICGAVTIVMWAIGGEREDAAPPVAAAPVAAAAGQVSKDAFGSQLRLPIAGREVTLRWCPPGRFQRGSATGAAWERPQPVVMSHGFWMLDVEISRSLWAVVMGDPPVAGAEAALPVGDITHDQARGFCERLGTVMPGLGARLPTEAEFEYACLAGRTAANEVPAACVNEAILAAWTKEGVVSDARLPVGIENVWRQHHEADGLGPRAVGLGTPNPWGISDLLGNQQEWCGDLWDGVTGYRAEEEIDPASDGGDLMTVRGGSWIHLATACRPTVRGALAADQANPWTGMRFVIPGGLEPVAPTAVPVPAKP